MCLCLSETFLCLTVIRQLSCQYELQALVVWHLLNSFLRDFGGLTPLLGFAVGIYKLLITAFSVVVSQLEHLAESVNRELSLARLATNRAESFEEDRAVVALRRGIVSRRLGALLDQSL